MSRYVFFREKFHPASVLGYVYDVYDEVSKI